MRRGVGLAAFDRHEQSKRSFAELSTQLSETQVQQLHSQLAQFRAALAHFASTHRDSIRGDPKFRHAFQQMCSSIGVDPLAGPRKGGWWAEMLGLGDWQYELGVQIVDLRGVDGGDITEEDIIRSIKTLEPLSAGYQVVDVSGRKMVRSVVKELDQDQVSVLAVARQTGGRVVEDMLVRQHGWSRERAYAALENMLLRDGLCWIDEQDEYTGRAYWIPSAMRWE
ncbi:vacuolar-sorting protein snf8 [Moniliophthora roreri]|nr:vacuolar-sorting protein snf8 [Moniliophthora roreri]